MSKEVSKKRSEMEYEIEMDNEQISAAESSRPIFMLLNNAIKDIRDAGILMPFMTDAKRPTLFGLADAEQILMNIRARITIDDPESTVMEEVMEDANE